MSNILDIDGFLNSLDSVVFKDKKSYQKEANLICKKELDKIRAKSKSLTPGDFDYSIGTLRRYRTDLRNAVRKYFQGKDLPVFYRDKDGAMTHIAVKYLTLKKSEVESYRNYEESRKDSLLNPYEDNLLVISNYQEMIQIAINLLSKDSAYDIALGLSLLTGRRSVEIWKTAKFTRFKRDKTTKEVVPCKATDKLVAKNEVLFSGQAKTGSSLKVRKAKVQGEEIPEKIYPIFTLADPQLIIDSLEKLHGMKDFSEYDNLDPKDLNRKINTITSSMMSRLVKEHFNKFILRNDGSKLVNYGFIEAKDLRSCYVHIAHKLFVPRSNLNKFATVILGHAIKITSENYMIFTLQKDDEK